MSTAIHRPGGLPARQGQPIGVPTPQRYRHGHQTRECAGELGQGAATFTPLFHFPQPDGGRANADNRDRHGPIVGERRL